MILWFVLALLGIIAIVVLILKEKFDTEEKEETKKTDEEYAREITESMLVHTEIQSDYDDKEMEEITDEEDED